MDGNTAPLGQISDSTLKARTTAFVRNAWYVAARSQEIGATLLARVLLDVPVVPFRTLEGAPAALIDACSHRKLPLSKSCLLAPAFASGFDRTPLLSRSVLKRRATT